MSMKARPPQLAIALDLPSKEDFFSWADTFAGLPVILKVGLGLLPTFNADDISKLHGRGFGVFIDAKLHDIPTQVEKAVQRWVEMGADYITLHLAGGFQMLERAVQVNESGTHRASLLGVSLLTSLGEEDLQAMGFGTTSSKLVEGLVDVGLKAGIKGFVSSVSELSLIQKKSQKFDGPFSYVTPGLSLGGVKASDQKRTATAKDALAAGANLLVLGRAILTSPTPKAEVEGILRLIEKHS